jgi:TRAP-type C4-dicarboxylate transport system permease large subunit
MDPLTAVGIACVLLLLLLAARFHVAAALLVSGLFGLVILDTAATPAAVVQSLPFTSTAHYSWAVIPMFVLMGAFASASGLLSSLFQVANNAFRRIPGGLALAAVATSAGFSAVSGSSVATAASIGPLAGREMYKAGYRGSFAAGVVAAAGTLGVLIPPSIILVIYGIATGESIAVLLVAGIAPGIISAVVIGAVIVGLRLFRPQVVMRTTDNTGSLVAATASRRSVSAGSTVSQKSVDYTPPPAAGIDGIAPDAAGNDDGKKHSGVGAVVRLAILFFAVMGGIYSGLVTVTEASAIGAVIALGMALIDVAPRGRKAVWAMTKRGFQGTASTTGMLFYIVVGASVFSYFFILAGVPATLSSWILSLDVPPWAVVVMILLAMIPLGMFLDPMAVMLIVVPLAYPIVVTDLGFSGIWFAILVVKMIEIGLITPPVGLNVFVTAGVMKEIVTTGQAFRGVAWFVAADLFLVLLFFVFPDLVTMWIPSDLG